MAGASKPKPVAAKAKRPRLDLSVPDEVRAAFVGAYLPVVITRQPLEIALKNLVAKLTPEERKRVIRKALWHLEGTIGTLTLKHTRDGASAFSGELAQLKVGTCADMIRAVPAQWFTEVKADDEDLALRLLCAFARAGSGIVYTRPGGRKLETNGDESVAFAFDFASGDVKRFTP